MTNHLRSVLISHDGRNVTFRSDEAAEIDAITACFGYFWGLGDDAAPGVAWVVTSRLTPVLPDVAASGGKDEPAGLFKFLDVRHTRQGDIHTYFHEIDGVSCVTQFDVSRKTVDFYHEAPVVEYSYIRNLVREPMLARYHELGGVAIHSSSCSIGGAGVMMPGVKGAGKSTLMTHLLARGAKFIGNDATLCTLENGAIGLTAVPQCVRLSQGSIENIKPLEAVVVGGRVGQFIEGKFEFMPSAFDKAFGGHHLSSPSRLDLILIPRIDVSRTDYAIEMGESEATRSFLREALFCQYHAYTWSPLFEHLNENDLESANFESVFHKMPEIRHLTYGILDDRAKDRLYRDISDLVA